MLYLQLKHFYIKGVGFVIYIIHSHVPVLLSGFFHDMRSFATQYQVLRLESYCYYLYVHFWGLSVISVDVDGRGKFLKLLRADSELLQHKSTLSCFGIPCFLFVEIDCTELLVLLMC